MRELLEQIMRQVHAAWRFRWYAMILAWIAALSGWVVVYKMPDQFEAAAQVHVDTQSILRPLLRGLAVDTRSQDRVQLMTRTLLSRPNLEKLARMTDLDLRATTPEQMDSLLESLTRRIKLQEVSRRDDLYTLAYSDSDRQLAKRVVQSLLTIFVESSLGQTRADTDAAQKFLEQQIRDYEQRLVAAERRLAEFKQRNVGLLPGDGRDYYGRLEQAMGAVQQARLTLSELQNRRESQARRLRDLRDEAEYSLLGGMSGSPQTSALDGRIQNLTEQLDNLLLRFTEQHPDVIETRRLLEALQAQRDAELMAASDEGGNLGNPMLQQLEIQLSETDAQIASMRVRVAEYERRVEELRSAINSIPEIEAELAQLNRDYSVNKSNYEALLERRESAKLSEQANISADDVKFRIIEPPHVPSLPSAPNRPLLSSVVLVGALAFGAVMAFLMAQIKPMFSDSRALKEITGVPVFGVVSMMRTPAYLRRRRWMLLSYGIAGSALILVYGLVMMIELARFDLSSLLA